MPPSIKKTVMNSTSQKKFNNVVLGSLAGTMTTGGAKIMIGSNSGVFGVTDSYIPRVVRNDLIHLDRTGAYATEWPGISFDPEDFIAPKIQTFPVLKKETCKRFINEIDKWEKTGTQKTFGTKGYTFYNHTHHLPNETADFFEEIRKHVPAEIGGWDLVGLTPYIAMAKYTVGQEFGYHKDARTKWRDGCEAKRVVLIYLNDDFEGGETIFKIRKLKNVEPAEKKSDEKVKGKSSKKNKPLKPRGVLKKFKPKTGHAIYFDPEIVHRGAKISKGVKYWISFELVYKPMH